MSTPVCIACDAPPGDGYLLCPRCGDDLARDLADVPDLTAELDTTRARQDRIGGDNAGRRTTDTPLPWKETAADATWVLADTLTAWAADLADTRNVTLDATGPAAVATWLARRLDWLRAHPQVEQAFGEIVAAVRNARRAVDRPAVLPYAGRCHGCGDHLYARMDRPHVICRACGHAHDTETLRQSLLDAVEHRNLSAAELAQSLPALLGAPLPLATVKTWIARGHLFRAGRDETGRATYRIRDVVTLATSRPTRRSNGSAA